MSVYSLQFSVKVCRRSEGRSKYLKMTATTGEEKNTLDQLSMENGIDENGNSDGRLNKYAFASVMAASIISVVFGYGE